MPKKITVIYHKADFDGIFCREIARKEYGDQADYIGWDYGDPLPVIAPEVTEIIMLDISVDGMMDDRRLIWIDHHKSAIEKYDHLRPRGWQIDGVAACRLAFQWFALRYGDAGGAAPVDWPTKKDFIDRKVSEPIAVRLAGEYDIWDKRDPDAELFQHGLRSRDLTQETWDCLLGVGSLNEWVFVGTLLEAGLVLQYAKTKENESIAKSAAFDLRFEGHIFCAINAARYNSHLFTAGIKPEHDGLLGFNYDGKQWRISLYGVPGKPDIDFSTIAVKYGGGGHKQACGFKLNVDQMHRLLIGSPELF